MWLRGLGLALLVWSPGVLHAIHGEGPCSTPSLKDGYFVPVQDSYPHGTLINYSCDTGYKPTVEGWWATSQCENGEWSDEPQCVVMTACPRPAISNAIFDHNSKQWYENESIIQINCAEGYSLNNQRNTVSCANGTWSLVLVCQKHPLACDPPPKVSNAVIIHQKYKEVFPELSKVNYHCKDGFLTEDKESQKSVKCEAGRWSEVPNCIDICGDHPQVPNGVVVEEERRYLKYQCRDYYKLVGSDTVVCHSDGTWSEVPRCKEDFCLLRAGDHSDLILTIDKYFRNGEAQWLDCVDKWSFPNYSEVRCINGELQASRCCNRVQIQTGIC
ncbi:complement factor H-like isoform X2 [Girardinichthys multiradiatus]|uniref:complement factor H-like isoform X2 n=1 Tax=Girardinichthys multiradiatus TaxID=208333 RepID=UPI001FABA82A|nr:complement factor H-like isoform X2 [Girardinichthys multiradiatus]